MSKTPVTATTIKVVLDEGRPEVGTVVSREMRSGGRKAAQAGPAKSLKERTLAAAPSGAWLVRFLVNTAGLPPRLAGLLEAKPCFTHGSNWSHGRFSAVGCLRRGLQLVLEWSVTEPAIR